MREDGKDANINEDGELWIKGPNVMKGYLNNPSETTNCIDCEGFLHTGDVARIDKHGHVFIVDRVKELIKYKGFQVPPAELEALLVCFFLFFSFFCLFLLLFLFCFLSFSFSFSNMLLRSS